MKLLKAVKALAVAITTAATVYAPAVYASSNTVVWQVYTSSQGSILSAKRVRSFLGSDEVSETVLMTANCSPNQPLPYVAVVVRPKQGTIFNPSQNMRLRAENGNYYFMLGTLDRIATANARDNFNRYGITMPTTHGFFGMLTKSGSRYYPKIDMDIHRDQSGGGARLEIFREQDRQKVRDFLTSCEGFQGQHASTGQPHQQPHACRDYLNGPNTFANNVATTYSEEIVNGVCGDYRMDVRPAYCMHYVMAGNLPWNQQGSTSWGQDNAASLCWQNTNLSNRIACFSNEIAKGNEWYVGINVCNEVN